MRPTAWHRVVLLVLGLVLAGCAPTSEAPPPAGASPGPGAETASPGVTPTDAPPTGPGPTAGVPTDAAGPVPTSGTWARLEVDGERPAAREDHTWTVGEDGRTAWLFGGRDRRRVFDDVWTFDLETGRWQREDVGGPAPDGRFGHEAAWLPGSGLLVWAGQAGATFFDDAWLLDPSLRTWQRLDARGAIPDARYGSCSGIGPDGRLWISHGFTANGARFDDTVRLNVETGRWADATPRGERPIERCLHACWWTSDGQLALYGGQTNGVPALGDLWFLTPGVFDEASNEWAEAPGQEAPARQLAAVARRDALTVIVGGRGSDGDPLADAWVVPDGGASLLALEIGEGPPARSGAALVDDPSRDRLVLFGGLGDEAFDDVWALKLG